jgi:hypothetical protein
MASGSPTDLGGKQVLRACLLHLARLRLPEVLEDAAAVRQNDVAVGVQVVGEKRAAVVLSPAESRNQSKERELRLDFSCRAPSGVECGSAQLGLVQFSAVR